MEVTAHPSGLGDRTVGEVVAEDYGRAEVFKRLGIDFCCGGDQTVGEVCRQAGISVEKLEGDLTAATREAGRWPEAHSWDLTFLARYIVEVHHRYLRATLPLIERLAYKVENVHARERPELGEIRALLSEMRAELEEHLTREEEVVFPLIAALEERVKSGAESGPVQTGAHLSALHDDHEHVGALMRRIRELSSNYQPPATACTTYRAFFSKLRELEDDLHRHVHLENNLLFPRAAVLQQSSERGS